MNRFDCYQASLCLTNSLRKSTEEKKKKEGGKYWLVSYLHRYLGPSLLIWGGLSGLDPEYEGMDSNIITFEKSEQELVSFLFALHILNQDCCFQRMTS